MNELILLSVIQGITEWLPISSEGILIFIMVNLFNQNPSSALAYAIFFHLGTMLSVLFKFRTEFLSLLNPKSFLFKVVSVSTIFTGVTALPLLLLVKNLESGRLMTLLIGLMLILTGVILRKPKGGFRTVNDMNLKDIVGLGLMQGLAIVPGISRSGITISYLLLRKIDKEEALRVSFIISVPAIIGAIVIEGFPDMIPSNSAFAIVAVTFVTSYLTMDVLLRFARRVRFSSFCMALGMLAISTALILKSI